MTAMKKIPMPEPDCVNGYIGWARIQGKGRGGVALKQIASGMIIERSPVVILPEDDVYNRKGNKVAIDDYIFCWEPPGLAPGVEMFAFVMGHIALCNHADNPNARIRQDHENNLMELIALRPIAPGEEITIDYGIELWFDKKD